VGNIAYQPPGLRDRPNARLTCYRKSVINGDAILKDNYLMGGKVGLQVGRWKHLEITGNTIWADGTLVELADSHDATAGWTIDGNAYFQNASDPAFICQAAQV
jgi:hypothetical protein